MDKKLNPNDCHKKNVSQDFIETLVFEATIKYVLRPKVIDKIAKLVADKFNAELSMPTVLLSLQKGLKEVNKSINSIMTAIENGIFTKTIKDRLLNLEANQADLKNKIAVEEARQVKPLQPNEVKKFSTYFAYMKYEKGEEKNEFFNSFINRVVLYDDKILIFYNTDTNHPAVIKRKDIDDLLAGIGEKIEKKSRTTAKNEKNSLEPQKFKRVSLGKPAQNRYIFYFEEQILTNVKF